MKEYLIFNLILVTIMLFTFKKIMYSNLPVKLRKVKYRYYISQHLAGAKKLYFKYAIGVLLFNIVSLYLLQSLYTIPKTTFSTIMFIILTAYTNAMLLFMIKDGMLKYLLKTEFNNLHSVYDVKKYYNMDWIFTSSKFKTEFKEETKEISLLISNMTTNYFLDTIENIYKLDSKTYIKHKAYRNIIDKKYPDIFSDIYMLTENKKVLEVFEKSDWDLLKEKLLKIKDDCEFEIDVVKIDTENYLKEKQQEIENLNQEQKTALKYLNKDSEKSKQELENLQLTKNVLLKNLVKK